MVDELGVIFGHLQVTFSLFMKFEGSPKMGKGG